MHTNIYEAVMTQPIYSHWNDSVIYKTCKIRLCHGLWFVVCILASGF